MKHYFIFSEGSKINQLICAFIMNLCTLAYGMGVGWMSPMTLLLQSENTPTDTPLTDNVVSWMASAPYISSMCSTFIFAVLEEKLGRKFAVLGMSACMVACWICKLASMSVWSFILARTFFGFAMGAIYVVCPVYIKEISEDSIRGALGSTVVVNQTLGNLITFILGDLLSYNALLWVCLAVPTLQIILFMMMPESPSYLVKNGQADKAVKVLAWLRCRREDDRVVLNEIDLIKKEQENDSDASGDGFAFKQILTDKILGRAFIIALMLTMAREVCGSNPVLNFAGYIFELASKGTDTTIMFSPNQQAMVLGAVQVAGTLLATSVVEKAGRKPLLFVSSLVSGLGMCALASWFIARDNGLIGPSWIPVVSLCLCIFCDAAGLQPMSVVVMNEIFSFKYRSTVSAITMATAATTDVVQLLSFKPIATSIGIHACFYFFGIVCLLNTVYVIIFVPETKMKNLDQIYDKLKTKREREEEENKIKELGFEMENKTHSQHTY